MQSSVIRKMDMPSAPIHLPDESWVQALQDELEVFDPTQATLCDVHLREYYALYGFNRLPEDVEYSAGSHWIGDTQLFLQYFKRRFARGTVVLLHGYTDHSGLYLPLIEHFLNTGWNVFTYDLPGHGVSSGEPLGVVSFQTYVRQLEALLNHYVQSFQGPVVLAGQSTGAAILLTLLCQSTPRQKAGWRIRGGVLLAPLIRPTDYYSVRSLYRVSHWWLHRIRRRFNETSHDRQFLTFRNERDPLQHRYMAMSWIGAMLQWIEEIEHSEPCEDPLLILQGTDDQTVNWRYNIQVLERLCPAAELQLIRDARHHLVNESGPYQEKVFAGVDRFLAKLSRQKPVMR